MGAVVSYWCCAQIEGNREGLALHCLNLAGFTVYAPRIHVRRRSSTRKARVQTTSLFPGYAFVLIELQWHAARWCPGVLRLILDGVQPARVPEHVILDLRSRERDGVVVLPEKRTLRPGDPVRVVGGLFAGTQGASNKR
jgi:transcriptional antiterminator RfaH